MGEPRLALLSSVGGNVSVGEGCLWCGRLSDLKFNVRHIAIKKANTIPMINFDPNDKFLDDITQLDVFLPQISGYSWLTPVSPPQTVEVQTPAARFLQLHPEFLCSWPPEFLPRLHAYAACIDLDLKLISPHSTKISSHTMQQMHLLQKKKRKKARSYSFRWISLVEDTHTPSLSSLQIVLPRWTRKCTSLFFSKKRISPQR